MKGHTPDPSEVWAISSDSGGITVSPFRFIRLFTDALPVNLSEYSIDGVIPYSFRRIYFKNSGVSLEPFRLSPGHAGFPRTVSPCLLAQYTRTLGLVCVLLSSILNVE